MTIDQIALRAIKENGLYLKYLIYKRGKCYFFTPHNWLEYNFYRLYSLLMKRVMPSFMRQFINRRIEIYIMNGNGCLTEKTTSFRIKGYSIYYNTFLIASNDNAYGFPCDMGRVKSIDGKPFKKWHLGEIIDKWKANETYELIDSEKPLCFKNV